MYRILVSPEKKTGEVSSSLYGIFFEDINRAGDGGLYAEMLMNRAFDDGVIPQGCVYDGETRTITSPTGWVSAFPCAETEGVYGWSAQNGARMALTERDTLNDSRKRGLEIHFCGGAVLNRGFDGLFLKAGATYRFYMFAKSERPVEVTVSLVSASGTVYAKQAVTVEGCFAKYECVLKGGFDDRDASLALSSPSPDMVTLGFTSLFPVDTFMRRENGLRKDLAEMLLALKPAFLRFPGGCVVEGFSRETAHRFEDTIGPVWERKPHWLLWGYNSTSGLGFHEFLQFCEDAQIDAMYVCNCGMTCQARRPDYFEDELVEEMYLDAVHAILYATASAQDPWGAKRAANGHPEPFRCLKYLEIGNENYGEEYHRRYRYFYERLKARFPQLVYIATDHTERAGLSAEMVDDHYYADPVFLALRHNQYEGTPGSAPDLYVGEYAATIGCKSGTLYGALGEAAFLTGIEKAQDKVKMTSYAPLLNHASYTAWAPDLIHFNNRRCYGIPSYYMLKMFAENRGSYVCEHQVITDDDARYGKGAFRYVSHGKTVTVGSPEQNSQSLMAETDVIDGRMRVSFWDSCAEGEDQDHYDLICEDGKSAVIHYNGWSEEVICQGSIAFSGTSAQVAIHTCRDKFEIAVNGVMIHKAALKALPHMFAVCTVDENAGVLLVKLVNLTQKDISVELVSESRLSHRGVMTTLTADSFQAGNSFDHPETVVPVTEEIELAEGILRVPARSVNIVTLSYAG